ncbi:Integrase zinc binding domain [Popillia japonica]|uniref:RNA-directed DNA polymerase n=1 Tax=Popillia japonica TaxID=7064 RepID=A0AAW1L5Z2_POPJA
MVYRKENEKILFYVPEEMVENVIRTSHEGIGHLGTDKVMDYVKQVYWFPNMKGRIKSYIKNCLKCIIYSPKYGVKEGFLHNIDKGNIPFDTIHIDHLGPLEKSKQYHRHVLVIIDAFTKFVKLFPCKSTTSQETIKYLRQHFAMYSRPRRIISDRGTCFTSTEFRRFVEEFDIQHVMIATGVPRANGQVEVVNRTLTGVTQRGQVSDRLRDVLLTLQEDERDLEQVRCRAVDNMKRTQEYSKTYYDKRHKEANIYSIGDYVVIPNVDTTIGVNKKLIPKFRGPFVITAVLPNDRYVVEDPPDFQNTQRPFKATVDAHSIKVWSKPT